MGALSGRVVFITGGSSGIGRAAAVRFAEEGAAVVVASRQAVPHEGGPPTHELIRATGGTAEFIAVDVTDEGSVDRGIAQVIARMGDLHAIMCSAGVLGPEGDTRSIDPEAFDRHFAVNVRGTFLCARRALRHSFPPATGRSSPCLPTSATSASRGSRRTALRRPR